MYISIQPYIQVCISLIPMSIIICPGTYALMHSCTHVLISSTYMILLPSGFYLYIYYICVYVYLVQQKLKYQTHLQNVLILV